MSAMLSRCCRPTIASIWLTSLSNSLPSRCGRQPATTTFRTLPFRFRSMAWRIASIASAFAGAMKPQVLMTMTSALSVSCVMTKPACAICASIRSLSTIFLGQPRATNPTRLARQACEPRRAVIRLRLLPTPRRVCFLLSFVVTGRYNKMFDDLYKNVILDNSLRF